MHLIKKALRILLLEGPVEFFRRACSSFNYRLARRVVNTSYDSIVIDSEDLERLATNYYELGHTKDLPTPKEQRNLVPVHESEYSELHLEPTFRFRNPFIATISDAFIAGENSLVYPEEGGMVGDTIDFDVHNEVFTIDRIKHCLTEDIAQNPRLIYPLLYGFLRPKQYSQRSHVAVLHGKSHTYFQWNIYQLLKIRAIEHYENITGNSVHLVIPPDPPSYITESLELLGYESSEYSEWGETPIRVNELIVPSFPEPTPEAIRWLRERILPQINDDGAGPQWIYISRQKADKRRIENFDEIRQVLDIYGIEIIELERYPLSKQISLIHNADGVIGPHGAGLVNMIWATELTVIELFGEVIDAPFFIIADVLRHEYKAISGEQVNSNEINRDADFRIDVDRLTEVLNKVGVRPRE